jgi:TonB family protein
MNRRHACADETSREFRLTMMDSAGLTARLIRELRFVLSQLTQAWLALKRDPIAFAKHSGVESARQLRRCLLLPNSLASIGIALFVMLSLVTTIVILGGASPAETQLARLDEESAQVVTLHFPDQEQVREGPGVGAGSEGRVGFRRGKGEGSEPKPMKARGGGAGGQLDPLPTQRGAIPPPSPIPAPIPKFPPVQKQALPVAGIDLDPELWKSLLLAKYGDPRSKSSAPSNGPGDDGGMGTEHGSGIGEGDGPGFGPGEKGGIGGGPKSPGGGNEGGSSGNNPDDPDRIYTAPQTTERARVLLKPEPQYTEEARKNGITGSVVLRVVFSRLGEVTNIRAIQSLPFGLTERAIAAARSIRFRPATRGGQPVNVRMQLEYNFNLY